MCARNNNIYTLVIEDHMLSNGFGRGRGERAAFRPSRWHILSYANIMDDHFSSGISFSVSYSQVITIKNT